MIRSRSGCAVVLAAVASFFSPTVAPAVVVPVEAGHVITKLVDSTAPLHPSQTLLETACALGTDARIESIGVNPANGTLYVQLADVGSTPTTDSCIFSVSPAGVATLINSSTGFGINERGTDLLFDPASGLLLTMDDNSFFVSGAERISTVLPAFPGTVGTYTALTPAAFLTATLGMGFARPVAGSDVPAGDLVFTADLLARILSAPPGGPEVQHVAPPATADDMVVQPDGDWIFVGDFTNGIINYSPVPPHTGIPSGFDLQTIFTDAGLTFTFGSRATVCPTTGDVYVSYSGDPGGTGVFRLDETLSTVTHVLTLPGPEFLQDLVVGPSTSTSGNSLFFTARPEEDDSEQVYEVTLPECPRSFEGAPALSTFGLTLVVIAFALLAWHGLRRKTI